MSTQNILWTALPNGFNDAGDKLRLSVFVTPRLVTDNGVDGTLAQFPPFLDWPATVAGLKFHVEFQGGPAFDLPDLTAPLDSSLWQALFQPSTFVRSFAFDDKTNLNVRSYPTQDILAFLKKQYQTIATASPSGPPDISQLGFSPAGQNRGARLDLIAITRRTVRSLEARLEHAFSDLHFVLPHSGDPGLDFYQLRRFHEFLSKRNPDGTPAPLPDQVLPKLDFHQVVSSLGQYPELMRHLGLAIDVEVPLDGVPAASNVRVTPSLPGVPIRPFTSYRLNAAAKRFLPAPGAFSDVTDGMLSLKAPDAYDIVEIDLDGAATKLTDLASNLARLFLLGVPQTLDTPQQYGLASMRSAGFAANRVAHAVKLVNNFRRSLANHQAVTADPQNANVVLVADDVTRGFRVDVWTSLSNTWHSLCLRNGQYNFLNAGTMKTFLDEGYVGVATTSSADGTTNDLRLPESLFRWAGWSLCAPRPGRTIGPKSTAEDATNPAATEYKLEVNFTVPPKTLPRLRFGARYQFRARAVDLAGNSLAPDEAIDPSFNMPPQPVPYLRFEPVAAPALVLRQALDPIATPGESLETIVIRSNYNKPIEGVSERHVAPPKTSQNMAETHGMFDKASGEIDKSVYAMLVAKDGSFSIDPAHPGVPVPHPEAKLELPYLPDPAATGAAFRILPGVINQPVSKFDFTGNWPEKTPFRLVLTEGSGAPELTESEAEGRVLTVQLDKADVVRVALSCHINGNDPSEVPPNTPILSKMGIWQWIVEANPPDLANLQQLALDGGHYMITPPRFLTLTHAVQQPLIEPEFQKLASGRVLGQTFARITDEFPISGKSTIKIDIHATWKELVDDGSDLPQPQILDGVTRAFDFPVGRFDTVAIVDGHHEFHDTKYRSVSYTAEAASRFREYFRDSVTRPASDFSRTSAPVTLDILNAARPAAPKPLYVIPTFGWEPKIEGDWQFKVRHGGGLRVYLDRPWFSSGDGELLGVVLYGCPPPQHAAFNPWEMPEALRTLTTQWGMDPIWDAPAPPSQAMPLPEYFTSAVAVGTGLTLDESPQLPFAVAGHKVGYDNARKLWFCDIEIDPGEAYFPFIRLALARYQPKSVADAHLSRVVLADFAQLLPDRSASIAYDAMNPSVVQLAVTGRTFRGPGVPMVQATVQMQAAGGGNLAWTPAETFTLSSSFNANETLWSAEIHLPAPRGSRHMRLLIEEFETFITSTNAPTQPRLIYADVLPL